MSLSTKFKSTLAAKAISSAFPLAMLVGFSQTGFSQTTEPPVVEVLKAFPSAEGYGKVATGGRGGDVYIVTNLNDSGEGSLREAIEASGPRTIVFEVSGTIPLRKRLRISNDNITIAGQTAPGAGITLKNYHLDIKADNVIIRYLRVRYGDETLTDADAISMRYRNNIILDHVTASWGDDETMSLYHGKNVTVQWSMITETLNRDGSHAFGSIWGSPYSTFHHNLIAHNDARNVRFASGSGYTDFRNNVIYNWGKNSTHGGEAQQVGKDQFNFTTVNMVGNYYKPGPRTSSRASSRLLAPGTRNGNDDLGSFYVAGNYMVGSESVTADNAKGVTNQNALMDQPWDSMKIEGEQTAEEAYISVLEHAGTSKVRDSVDARIVEEVRNGTATYGDRGVIESQDEVGGWPELESELPAVDSDRDGMPDDWELLYDLDASDPDDKNQTDSTGYTMLERYINGLVD